MFSTTCASAQLLRVGVAGGLPLTDVFNARTDPNQPVFQYLASPFQSATQRTVPYIVGPAVEVRLTSRFGIEVDALYSRGTYNYTEIFTRSPSLGSALQETKHAANLWDFPVLLKYRTSVRPGLRPFVGAGISVQYATDGVVESLFGTAGPVGRPFIFPGSGMAQPAAQHQPARPLLAVSSSVSAECGSHRKCAIQDGSTKRLKLAA
jgi:hypothetical protein